VSLELAAVAIVAYLIGSVPFGMILIASAGLGDIRKLGSGNIGATNVLRTGRRGLAAATLLLDGLKGAAAVWIGAAILHGPLAAAVAGICAALGHCFPVWLRFAGGKGVATMLGIALAFDWRVALLCCTLWIALARLTRISSAGGIGAALALPAALFILDGTGPVAWSGLLVSLLVLLRHHANIGRLLTGTEPRIGGRA